MTVRRASRQSSFAMSPLPRAVTAVVASQDVGSDPATSAVRRALLRLLRTAFGDDAKAAGALREALGAAGLDALPIEPDALLAFASTHLGPIMLATVNAGLVLALVDDLEAEIEYARGGPNRDSTRMATSTSLPPGSESARRISCTLEVSAPRVANPGVAAGERGKLRVALVDPDRFGRASLARVLTGGRCDVSAYDDVASLVSDLGSPAGGADRAGGGRFDVVVVAVDRVPAATLTGRRAGLSFAALLAWTRRPADAVAAELAGCEVAKCAIVTASTRSTELLEVLRNLAGQ